MLPDNEPPNRRIPSLVQFCQRVAAAHADSICSLGDTLPYDLLQPILENCSPETLLRLEQSRPGIEGETLELWKRLCFRTYPIPAEKYRSESAEEPESWRDEFFLLREMEAKRFEQLGTRLRNIRQEEAERKKESQIKITDRLPPTKRARAWGNYQPKTLLQKARSDAAKLQKGIYDTRIIPPMPTAKTWRATSSDSRTTWPLHSSSSPVPSASTSTSSRSSGSRVTVTSVSVRRPVSRPKPEPPLSMTKSPPYSSSFPTSVPSADFQFPMSSSPPQSSPPRSDAPLSKRSTKKDPLSTLFMPKHRAHSQLPAQPKPSGIIYPRT